MQQDEKHHDDKQINKSQLTCSLGLYFWFLKLYILCTNNHSGTQHMHAIPRWESPFGKICWFPAQYNQGALTTWLSLCAPADAREGLWAMRAWLKIVRQTTGETHLLLLLLPQPLLHCFAKQHHQLSSNTTFTQKPCECCDILNRCGE